MPMFSAEKTYLAYGSSITHGSLALAAPCSYPFQIARRLGCDYLNLGYAGSAYLEREMAEYIVSRGGFVGYFGYNLFAYAEPTLNLPPSAANDYDLLLFTDVIAYDHLKQKITIAVNMDTDRIMENYGRACAKIESIEHMIYSRQPLPRIQTTHLPSHFLII